MKRRLSSKFKGNFGCQWPVLTVHWRRDVLMTQGSHVVGQERQSTPGTHGPSAPWNPRCGALRPRSLTWRRRRGQSSELGLCHRIDLGWIQASPLTALHDRGQTISLFKTPILQGRNCKPLFLGVCCKAMHIKHGTQGWTHCKCSINIDDEEDDGDTIVCS